MVLLFGTEQQQVYTDNYICSTQGTEAFILIVPYLYSLTSIEQCYLYTWTLLHPENKGNWLFCRVDCPVVSSVFCRVVSSVFCPVDCPVVSCVLSCGELCFVVWSAVFCPVDCPVVSLLLKIMTTVAAQCESNVDVSCTFKDITTVRYTTTLHVLR